MIHWLWLLLAFGAGWFCHAKLFSIGIRNLLQRGMKVTMPK